MQEEQKIKCPKCGSGNLLAGKHGFSAGKALGGALLTGGIGVLAGMHGANRIDVTCIKCGYVWQPLQEAKALQKEERNIEKKMQQKARSQNEKQRRRALSAKDRFIENLITAAIIVGIIALLYWLLG